MSTHEFFAIRLPDGALMKPDSVRSEGPETGLNCKTFYAFSTALRHATAANARLINYGVQDRVEVVKIIETRAYSNYVVVESPDGA